MTSGNTERSLPRRIQTAHATVTDLIRAEILSGRLAPGERLTQNDLAKQFNLSTTPIREALRQLAAEGLLDADPHRGMAVHATSEKELRQIHHIRIALESLEIRAAVENMSDAEVDRAEEVIGRISPAMDAVDFARANAEFHSIISQAADWPRLAAILENLRVLASMYMAAWLNSENKAEQIARSNDDHRQLLDAIRRREPKEAQAVIEEHIGHTREAGLRALRAENENSRAPIPRRPARAAKTIRVLGITTTMKPEVLDRFYQETGIVVEPVVEPLTGIVSRALSEPEQYDAIDQNATYLEPMLQAGVLAPIPVDEIPQWAHARPLFTDPEAEGAAFGWPLSQVFTDDSQDEFHVVPQYFNLEAFGYNKELTDEAVSSYGAMFHSAYAGRVAIWNDAIWTIGMVHNYLAHAGEADPPAIGPGDLTKSEVDLAISFLRRKKRTGQFRAFWTDISEATPLLASGEIAVADAWIPAFEDARRISEADLRYTNPTEGNRPWFHGLGLSAASDKVSEVATFANWRLEGWFGAQVAPIGYYSPTTTVEDYLDSDALAWWYNGVGRGVGSLEERLANVAFWPCWPREYDYYLSVWSRFLAS